MMHLRRPWLAAGLALSLGATAQAQGGLLLQGIADVEGWSTDNNSNLLTRNAGRPAALARLHLWSAVEPWRGLFLFAHAEGETGKASFGDRGTRVDLRQAGVRLARDSRFVVNVGKLAHPASAFATRMFSTRNPLVGVPDGYSPVYPIGGMVSGEIGLADYRAGVVSLPLTHRDYVPDADADPHPVVGIGFTPIVGLRVGATATAGSYLNSELTSSQLAGKNWQSYRQRLIAGDIQFGFGHVDLRAEYAWADYDVPGKPRIDGNTAYLEGSYTVTPRIFIAGRGETNNYPFVRPISSTNWVSRRTLFNDLEAGVGFRATESTLLKVSYRFDDWTVTPENSSFVRPGGKALAMQLSQSFDVMESLARFRR